MMTASCTRLVIGVLLLASTSVTASANGRLSVYTVNYPLKYFAERIGQAYADVELPIPSDIDPAFWRPEPEHVVAYQLADLILLNGADYARWTGMASLPYSRLTDTSAAFAGDYIETADTTTHAHGPDGKHSHAGRPAFTTWLDFSQAAKQAAAIMQAMSRKRPEHKKNFARNFGVLEQELLALDAEIKTIVAAKPGQPMIGSHPVYQYFARRYGINLKSVHWEAKEIPDEVQWAELQAVLETHPAKWMIWEAEPSARSVERLSDLGINSLVFNPSANVSDSGDWLSVMRQNVKNLAAAFE